MLLPPRYEPIAALGKGGGGEVWSAKDRATGSDVALKILATNADEAEMLALVREAIAMSGLEGVGVPRILGFGRLAEGARAYLVRELVPGKSLADCLENPEEPLTYLSAVAQVAEQLTRLHRASLLHGDLKPANIIVGPDGRATLVDLGLAATLRDGGQRPSGLTPRYAAPELFAGGSLTVRAEVFALGVTLGETLAVIRSSLDPAVARALEEVVRRATDRDPRARFPSADEVGSAIRSAAGLPPHDVDRAVFAWPIIGLDAVSSALDARVEALREGGGLVVTGPPGAGKTTLLRRLAWWLGVKGRAVAWIEASLASDPGRALDLELSPFTEGATPFVLVDDADRLDAPHLERLALVRAAGARLIVTFDAAHLASLLGPTFELFDVPPLDEVSARELVRRAIPSLGDVVADHVARRAAYLPGKIRQIVDAIARAPVASVADVDRILVEHHDRRTDRERVVDLLNRGHFEEAAEVLEHLADDPSPLVVIARARLFTNRGEPRRAIEELERVRDEVLEGDDVELASAFCLHASRALLRAGDHAAAEKLAEEALVRTGIRAAADDEALLDKPDGARPRALLSIAADALAVMGLSQSFAARHDEGKRTLERSVRLARVLTEPRILSVALGSLAFALQRDAQLDAAKTAYEQALEAAERAGDAGSVATTRLNLAGIAKTQGDIAASLTHLEAAVDMGQRSGRVATLRQALLNLANLDLYLGRLAHARASIDELVRQRDELGPHLRAQLLSLEAEHASLSGNVVAAERLCGACADAWEALGRLEDAAEARLERVVVGATLRGADARMLDAEIDRAALALGGGAAHRPLLLLARARVAALRGDERAAAMAYDEALEVARSSGLRDLVVRVLDARAMLHEDGGKPMLARRDREAAVEVLEGIASLLPRDLREVFWDEPRRRNLRSACLPLGMPGAGATSSAHLSQAAMAPRHIPTEERLARILEINRAIAGEIDLARLLDKATEHAIALLGAERGFVLLKSGYADQESSSPHASGSASSVAFSVHAFRGREGDDPHARFSQSIAERVVQTGESIATVSAREDARMADYVSVHQLMLQSIACVPIRARIGTVIGALYLETRLSPAAGFSQELPTLGALADQVAIAIETARLVGENARRASELEKKSAELERANRELEAAHAELEQRLGHRTEQLEETRRDLRSARALIKGHFGYEGLVGRSEAMRRVYALIDRVKDTDVPVLIMGESGTGKEGVARAVHNAGSRAKKPFVGINVGAIPEHLLESELFGHVRGAFTGADRDRRGLFREATGGTILLDEIGEMPAKMQASLLRVLQEKVVRPVGGTREEPVSVRVIAATHRDLSAMVQAGTFREDLLYRLDVVKVHVPPLRERIEDIPLLIDHFLGIFAARYGRERRSVSRAALRKLMGYTFPGNVRQLENILLNAWVLSDRPELDVDDFELSDARTPARQVPAVDAAPPTDASRKVVSLEAHKADERERILAALQSASWNRVKAAKIVGLPRRTFYRRLKEYGIQ